MKKIIFILVLTILLLPVFCVTAFAEENVDYAKIYMDYAEESKETASGMMMVDLEGKGVPQIFIYTKTTGYFDENGRQIATLEEGLDNVVFKEITYSIDYLLTIKNGKVVSYILNYTKIPYRLGESPKDYKELCRIVTDASETRRYLAVYDASVGLTYKAYYLTDNGVDMESGPFEPADNFAGFYNKYTELYDIPSAYVDFYDEKSQTKLTRPQAMEILLNNYANPPKAEKVSAWAKADVEKAIEYGLVPTPMLEDDLTKNITRAEFAGIASKLSEELPGKEINYPRGLLVDIDGNPYEQYIYNAYDWGITNGTGHGEKTNDIMFSPNYYITREQLATMLCRVIKLNKFEGWTSENDSDFPLDISNTTNFSDDSSISPYANEAVYYMSKHGIIKGVDSTRFAPQDTATKEQAILLALRIYNSRNDLLSKEEVSKPQNAVTSTDFEDYIGMDYVSIKAIFGEPIYAVGYDNWYYSFYKFGEDGPAFCFETYFTPMDGTKVYANDEKFVTPKNNDICKSVLVSVNQWMDSVKETHNMEDVLKTDRCSFNDSTDVWAGVNYHVGYNREKVLQYFFHAKGFEIPGNDLILIQDYSHNIAD